jgi:hypothetical protein
VRTRPGSFLFLHSLESQAFAPTSFIDYKTSIGPFQEWRSSTQRTNPPKEFHQAFGDECQTEFTVINVRSDFTAATLALVSSDRWNDRHYAPAVLAHDYHLVLHEKILICLIAVIAWVISGGISFSIT